jgi:hypothetical protein
MLIGLCGKPQSGKSEVRKILTDVGFVTLNTKVPLIHACSRLTGLEPREFIANKEMLYKDVPLRKIMGSVQNAMEDLFGDYHSVERVTAHLDAKQHYVLDALRKTQPDKFPGFIVEVQSNLSLDTGNPFDEYSRKRIDHIIDNNGNLGHLEENVFKMLEALGVRT